MSTDFRRHPRFVAENIVEVHIASRDELRELWAVDISRGGMFVETDAPPPRGTRLEIRLQTPDGPLSLKAEAVHIVDVATAEAYAQQPGVGVQFVDLTKEAREQIEQYVNGIASKLSTDLIIAGTEGLDVLLAEAKRITDALDASDVYGALQMPPGASSEQLAARIERLCDRFASAPPDSSPPKVERLRQAARQLERNAPLFTNQLKRLQYDFHHGFVRADARRKAGENCALLKAVWSDMFPDRIISARAQHRKASEFAKTNRFEQSVATISRAIELDPFDQDYRALREAWRTNLKGSAHASTADLTRDIRELAPRLDLIDDFELLGLEPQSSTEDIGVAFDEQAGKLDPEALAKRVPAEIVTLAGQVSARLDSAKSRLTNRATRTTYQHELTEKTSTPAEAARMKNEIGLAHLRRSDFENARRFLNGAVELNPIAEHKMNAAWAMLADPSFDRTQAYDLSLPLLLSAIRNSNTHDQEGPLRIARCHYYLGRLLREQGRLPEAEKQLAKAVGFDSQLTDAVTELRLIRMRIKRKRPGFKEMFKRT